MAIPHDKGYTVICSAQNESAVSMLKNCFDLNPTEGVNIWVDADARIERLVGEVPEVAWDLVDSTEGEITIMLSDAKQVAKSVMFKDQSIAVTITKHTWAKKIIQQIKTGLVAIKCKAEMPENLEAQVDVLILPSEKSKPVFDNYPIIKIAPDGGIKIIRREGIQTLPHV